MAQNYLKKQQMIEKYKGLEAKIEGVKISLANITTSQALVDTMQTMGGIMKNVAGKIDVNNIQKVITDFNLQYEKQQVISDMVGDAMDMDGDEIEDTDADALIDNIAGVKDPNAGEMNADANFNAQLDDLKPGM